MAFYKLRYTDLIKFEIVTQLINYDFIAFGFTVAAMAIVFAVPNGRYIDMMFKAAKLHPEKGSGPWEDALFIMTWNGAVHFFALIGTLIAIACSFNLSEEHYPFIWDASKTTTKVTYGFLIAVQIYALLQFFMTLLSIYFFCMRYVASVKLEWTKAQDNKSESKDVAREK